MVTEEITVTVKVTKTGIHLAKVIHGNGYQLVCGGRLVSETKEGTTTPYPDMPEYTPDMFPTSWDEWALAQADARVEAPAVRIEIQKCHRCPDGKDRIGFVPCGLPRVAAYLFGVHPKDDVVAWIRKESEK